MNIAGLDKAEVKLTPFLSQLNSTLSAAEKGFAEFAAIPLVKLLGVDHASFIAGYETAVQDLSKKGK